MFEPLVFFLAAIVAIVFLVPLTVCLLYFSVHRARARDDDSAARYRNRKKRFKRIVNRAILLLVCLFALVLAAMFAQLHWLGAMSGWGFGMYAWTGAELVFLALLGVCGAYFGYALANCCLPAELKE
ncbi:MULTISPECIES: hypothetical protein [Ralstonia]|uniref:hypothetical protein n=1 Tax=Ralstonia TaxID=48736 RepID=UPI000ABF42F0|nr:MULTISPECIES: hypothetical protein [Ralstonia]PLT17282.1 hypothetical protein CXP34_11530 [Ralstonia mannitolilytica]